jgi:FxsC-like protein
VGIYFFLSYAHSSPLLDGTTPDRPSDPDHWVKVFYGDLHRRVRQLATPGPGWEIGFIDEELSAATDWKEQLARALGASETFVPLYSPGYLNRAWPLSERGAFDERLRTARRSSAMGHVLPVLWIPIQSAGGHRELATARLLGADLPDYVRHGLRALCMLRTYQDQYTTIVDRLAREIVRVTEHDQLGASLAPAPSGVADAQTSETPFVISVLAPTEDTTGPKRTADRWYGPSALAWRPFGEAQALPLVDYALNVVERFGLPTRVVEHDTALGLFKRYPGLLFIDPWILNTASGAQQVRTAIAELRSWVTVVVVTNQVDAEFAGRGATLAADITGTLNAAGFSATGIGQDPNARRVWNVRDVEDFIAMMPTLVARTRRRFLQQGDLYPPKGTGTQPPWLQDANGQG